MIEITIALVLAAYLYDFRYIFSGKKPVGTLITFPGGHHWDNSKAG